MINFKKVDYKIVGLDFTGEITGEDYKSVKPEIEKVMADKGKVKFLMDMRNVDGFKLDAVYQDIKFDVEHFKNIGATAIIASKKTYEFMVKAINLIYPEKVCHFETPETALNWLKGQA